MPKMGNVRKIDRCGRISIPVKLRRELNIEIFDPLEVQRQNDTIVLQKAEEPKEETVE